MKRLSPLRTKWTDPEVLILTLIHLNLKVKIDVDVRGYNGQRVGSYIVCLSPKGQYDLRFSLNYRGSYDMTVDLWGLAKQYNQTDFIGCISGTVDALSGLKRNGDLKKYLSNVAFYREGWYLEQEWIDKLAQEYRKNAK